MKYSFCLAIINVLLLYWTIVIALVQKRSLCLAIINVLLDNSYCSGSKAIALFGDY
ncbi:hypothetical protein [Okeania sp. SIO2G5]|uniref:hypothetical protein n=1 Tax=Okeania sp. SIO2G5 TaxID=2607796 RepID=UPI0013B8053E|nr:hypothetical protein [Okeania sp. SIO2G5]NEP72765.1 hypothetical protein [Okeania sp. SIO2G5]NEP93455.1 hypothetical protein [Okeania sp. SIO2F5]